MSTGALISGSNALQFLDRTCYPDSDLDIYVDVRPCTAMANYLMNKAGYTLLNENPLATDVVESLLRPVYKWSEKWTWKGNIEVMSGTLGSTSELYNDDDIDDEEYTGKSFGAILNFEKAGRDGQKRSVQLIGAGRGPLDCILQFHSRM
jgi:hypothetical protein